MLTGYGYDDLNRLLTESTGGVATAYGHDQSGNRTSKIVSGQPTITYVYDTHDRLVSADVGNDRVFEADYDYRTRRLAKREATTPGDPLVESAYRYDGGVSFQDLDGQGELVLEHVRAGGMGGGIGSILYAERHNSGGVITQEHFAYNAVGHTVSLSDGSGTVTSATAYEAFGNVAAQAGNSQNDRLANTKQRDFSIGLDNHGFRYYDPSSGRYITRDPIGYGDGMNVYRHVSNNPVNGVDPLGLSKDDVEHYAGVTLTLSGDGGSIGFGVGTSFRADHFQVALDAGITRRWGNMLGNVGRGDANTTFYAGVNAAVGWGEGEPLPINTYNFGAHSFTANVFEYSASLGQTVYHDTAIPLTTTVGNVALRFDKVLIDYGNDSANAPTFPALGFGQQIGTHGRRPCDTICLRFESERASRTSSDAFPMRRMALASRAQTTSLKRSATALSAKV